MRDGQELSHQTCKSVSVDFGVRQTWFGSGTICVTSFLKDGCGLEVNRPLPPGSDKLEERSFELRIVMGQTKNLER